MPKKINVSLKKIKITPTELLSESDSDDNGEITKYFEAPNEEKKLAPGKYVLYDAARNHFIEHLRLSESRLKKYKNQRDILIDKIRKSVHFLPEGTNCRIDNTSKSDVGVTCEIISANTSPVAQTNEELATLHQGVEDELVVESKKRF